MDDLNGIRIFKRVVEAKSFTAAADRLGISQAQVSKEITRLERTLGARLLNRTTRRLSLTEVGNAFYAHCQRIETEINAAKAAVASLHADVNGIVRVSAPVAFGVRHIAPAVTPLIGQYPKLQIDLVLDDRPVDLLKEGFDIAIRLTCSPHPSLVARRLAPIHWIACGAPSYFERCGMPMHPAELSRHHCLVYPHSTISSEWEFHKDGQRTRVSVSGHFSANNGEALCRAAVDGLGIVMMPSFLTGEDLRQGRLMQVLPDYDVPVSDVYAVYLPNRYLLPKIRAFIDFFVERFRPAPYWDRWRDHGNPGVGAAATRGAVAGRSP